ncbi:MAG: hypothetical protein AAFW47_01995 [Pseudomonadota bacterium]
MHKLTYDVTRVLSTLRKKISAIPSRILTLIESELGRLLELTEYIWKIKSSTFIVNGMLRNFINPNINSTGIRDAKMLLLDYVFCKSLVKPISEDVALTLRNCFVNSVPVER